VSNRDSLMTSPLAWVASKVQKVYCSVFKYNESRVLERKRHIVMSFRPPCSRLSNNIEKAIDLLMC